MKRRDAEIALAWLHGEALKTLGKRYGLSSSRCSQIKDKVLRRVKARRLTGLLARENVTPADRAHIGACLRWLVHPDPDVFDPATPAAFWYEVELEKKENAWCHRIYEQVREVTPTESKKQH